MTDDPNARPSLSERYVVAFSNGTGVGHIILAAGMQHERLGVVLLRLQSEYDAVKGDLERAGQIAPQRTAQARELTQRAKLAERLKDYGAAEALKALAADIHERRRDEPPLPLDLKPGDLVPILGELFRVQRVEQGGVR